MSSVLTKKQMPVMEKIPFALSPWPYLLAYTIPLSLFLAIWIRFPAVPLIYGYMIVPFFDLFAGLDVVNPTKAMERQLREDVTYRLIVLAWVPVHFFMIAYSVHVVCNHNTFSLSSSPGDFFVFAFSLGSIGAVGINVAHEMIHKASWIEPAFGRFMLAMVCYEHFFVEHLRGHHKRVATPEDPASAPLHMTSWYFVCRSVVLSLRSALQIDPFTVLMGFFHTILIFSAMVYTIVPAAKWNEAFLLLFLQGVTAFSLLEFINYVEHYGLQRTKLANGEYEPVTRFHSWNASHRFTNYFLFKLQRHSDHHFMGGKRYQVLRTYSASPHLPYGYGGMIVMAIVTPSYFKKVMNPRAEAAMEFMRECHEKGVDPFALEENEK